MGFIKDNTNNFDIYLTDLGRQKMLDGGFKTAVTYFSLSDSDANYEYFVPNPNEILLYDSTNLANYNPGDYVVTGGTYYRFVLSTGTRSGPPSSWWESVVVFNPNVITAQPIPTYNHNGSKLTSLGNNNIYNDDYINDVFVQLRLRGGVIDNKISKKVISVVNNNTQGSYILYDPNVVQSTTPLLTYLSV